MSTITSTEFRKHIGKYTELARTEEILVTYFGKPIFKIVSISNEKTRIVKSLVGILPKDTTFGVDPNERGTI